MRYISLKNTSLTFFNSTPIISEMSGSSKYMVEDGVITCKRTIKQNKIESTTALTDYLTLTSNKKNGNRLLESLVKEYKRLIYICIIQNFNFTQELEKLDIIHGKIELAKKIGTDTFIELEAKKSLEIDKNKKYYKQRKERSEFKEINRTKVKGKMFALFNLKCSKKFMAFYSISFPINSTDDQAFICLNYWLTLLRKKFGLENYIWVTERQKNGTLHFHILTNNYMPIMQINRAMAIIIDNQVRANKMCWDNSSLEKYNGVDVDSIWNSSRHKKTGKKLNPVQVRQWITNYVTKYVTKNTEKFRHLCWHCSRSISTLFTSQLIVFQDRFHVTGLLPTFKHLYENIKTDFCDIWIFKFVPPECLFNKIKMINDRIFEEFEPRKYESKSIINFKTIAL